MTNQKSKNFISLSVCAVLLLYLMLPGNVFAANHEKYLDSYIDFENMDLGAATQQQISDNYAVTYNAESEPNAQNGGAVSLYPNETWSNGVDTYTSVAVGGNDLVGKAIDDKYLALDTNASFARFVFCPSKLWEMIDLYKNAGTTVNNVLNISFDIAVNRSGQNQDIFGYLGWGNGGAQRISLFDMKYGSNGIRLLSESSGFPSSGGIDANVWHHLDYQLVQTSATELLASVWADGKYIMTKNVMPASGYDGQFDRVYFDIAQGNRMYLDNLHIQAIPAENILSVANAGVISGDAEGAFSSFGARVSDLLEWTGSGFLTVEITDKDTGLVMPPRAPLKCGILKVTRVNSSVVYIPITEQRKSGNDVPPFFTDSGITVDSSQKYITVPENTTIERFYDALGYETRCIWEDYVLHSAGDELCEETAVLTEDVSFTLSNGNQNVVYHIKVSHEKVG